MIQLKFRGKSPCRTYNGKELSDYKYYKNHLVLDFNRKCGYSDCSHSWFGGQNNFQIDHFKPKSKFPKLETKYSNLVYSCSYINRAKSDDLGTYLDPCDEDYNDHFYRDELGNIYPKDDSDTARFMYLKLKLYLKRYGIIWMLEQLEIKMNKLKILIEETDDQEAKDLLIAITFKFLDYLKYLKAVQ
ncbi:MAG TPA: HNH endonuclease domain-containing protein [Panacibacter sp.]|nr:HNH endonuclease domain-containing protein [Panacibacter sp.]